MSVRFHPSTYIYQYIMTELPTRSLFVKLTLPARAINTATLTTYTVSILPQSSYITFRLKKAIYVYTTLCHILILS